MGSTQTLPDNYQLASSFSMKDRRLLLWANLIGLVLLVFFGWLFISIALTLRAKDAAAFLSLQFEGLGALLTIAVVLAVIFVTITLHEAIHGLGFLWLAHARPIFAFRGAYAYAAAPGWYIPRNPYLVIGLAPLVVISLLGIGLIAFAPTPWLAPVLLACVVNASGAVGDLWVAVLLLRKPSTALASDLGDEIKIYVPTESLPVSEFH